MRERGPLFHETELGARFASGATSGVGEGEQFVRRPALEPFGDIVGDRHGAPLNLVPKARANLARRVFSEVIHTVSQAHGLLPHRQIFETLIGHGMLAGEVYDWRMESGDLRFENWKFEI